MNDSRSHPALWLALAALLAAVAILGQLAGPPADVPPGPPRPAPHAPVRLSRPLPDHLDYAGVCAQLREWEAEAQGLAEVGNYGTSRGGRPLTCFHVHGRTPAILVHACIHGNEPLAASVVLGYCGRVLSTPDPPDVWFVPVVCPDSYPSRREVEGGQDPNRDFPGLHDPNRKSTPQVAAIQELFRRVRPAACWSGHTSGRVFLIPPGDTTTPTAEDAAYRDLFGRMASAAQYRLIHACEMYGRPIRGSEVDWYHAQGAAGCVCEYGTIQRPASPAEIREEFNRTWPAFELWLREAPRLRIPRFNYSFSLELAT